MAYEGVNKNQVNKLKKQLSKVKTKSGFVGEKTLAEIVDEALTGRGNEEKLDDAWNGAQSLNDRQLLAQIYLLSRDDYYNNIKDSESIWTSVFVDLGFNKFENPFMQFLEDFNYTGPLDKEGCRKLCNAYADGVVSDTDLKNKNSFVYNPSLYEKGVDVTTYLDLNKQLSNSSVAETIAKNISEDAGREVTPEQARNLILFGTYDATPNRSPIIPIRSVKAALEKYGKGISSDRSVRKTSAEDDDVTSELIRSIGRLSDADREYLFRELVNKFGMK